MFEPRFATGHLLSADLVGDFFGNGADGGGVFDPVLETGGDQSTAREGDGLVGFGFRRTVLCVHCVCII